MAAPSAADVAGYLSQVVAANHDTLATAGSPDRIYAGQVFALPVPAATAGPPAPAISVPPPIPVHPAPPSATATVVTAPGDSFWSVAERVVSGRQAVSTEADVAAYWVQLVSTNEGRLAPPGNPDLIYPGQTFALP
jgi:nucleoid-associated protein YgaU